MASLESKGSMSIQMSRIERPKPSARVASGSRDEYELARTGKRQVLNRQFGLLSMLGFGCITLATWEGVLSLFIVGFTNGGPAGMIYGFILAWIGVLSVFLTLSELASMMPTSGGQYHWTAMLAPPSTSKGLSYVTGWLTICNWEAALILGVYLIGNMIQALVVLNNSSYVPEAWQAVLISWAFMLFAIVVNIGLGRILAKIEGAILIMHVLGFFAILIPVVYLAPSHTPASEVFTLFINHGGWSSQGLSFWIGLSSSVLIFAGADSIVHMTEEVHHATVNVPWAIVGSIVINGLLGFGMLIALLFTLPDLELLGENAYLFPFIQLFLSSNSSVPGTTAMTTVVVLLNIFSTISLVATSSRMIWAFARDRGLPGWQRLQKVDAKTSVPTLPILIIASVAMLFQLIAIGSPTILSTILSLSVCGAYGSYLVPASLLLWRRLQPDAISPSVPRSAAEEDQADRLRMAAADTYVIHSAEKLMWGPWRLPGLFGIINNIYAICWMLLGIFFSMWPSAVPVTPDTMNYSVVVTAGVAIISFGYYVARGRRSYTGPRTEI